MLVLSLYRMTGCKNWPILLILLGFFILSKSGILGKKPAYQQAGTADRELNYFEEDFSVFDTENLVAGEIIPIESTSLILAGAQSFSWMIPLLLSVLGIGLFVVSRKNE